MRALTRPLTSSFNFSATPWFLHIWNIVLQAMQAHVYPFRRLFKHSSHWLLWKPGCSNRSMEYFTCGILRLFDWTTQTVNVCLFFFSFLFLFLLRPSMSSDDTISVLFVCLGKKNPLKPLHAYAKLTFYYRQYLSFTHGRSCICTHSETTWFKA